MPNRVSLDCNGCNAYIFHNLFHPVFGVPKSDIAIKSIPFVAFEFRVVLLGDEAFDDGSSNTKISVVKRQGPNTMQVIRQ